MSNVTNTNIVGKYLKANISGISDDRLKEYCKFVNENGAELSVKYKQFIQEMDICPYEYSVLDFEEEYYFLHQEFENIMEI